MNAIIQLKDYSERGLTTTEQRIEGDLVASQGGVRYKQGPFKVGLGAVETLYAAVVMVRCNRRIRHNRSVHGTPRHRDSR